MFSLAAEIRSELRRLADDLDRCVIAAVDAVGVYIVAQPTARQATRLLIRAACVGLLGDPRAVVDRVVAANQPNRPLGADELATIRKASALIETDRNAADAILAEAGLLRRFETPSDNFVWMLLRAGRVAEFGREPTAAELGDCRPLSNEAVAKLSRPMLQHDPLLNLWGVVICPYLRATRPGDFRPDLGEYDFPPLPHEARKRLNEQLVMGVFDWQAAAASRVAHPYLGPVGEYPPSIALTHARAQIRVWAEAMRAAADLIVDGVQRDNEDDAPPFTTAADYSWVKWQSGQDFHFTGGQREAVREMCLDYLNGKPSTDGPALLKRLTEARSTNAPSMEKLFKVRAGRKQVSHPAWGTMIVPVKSPGARGRYTVQDPG